MLPWPFVVAAAVALVLLAIAFVRGVDRLVGEVRSRRFATEQEAGRALARTPADKREGAFIDEIHEVE